MNQNLSAVACEYRLSSRERLSLAGTGTVLLAMLITARVLEPAESGFGTHHQLGLPPCSVVQLFGVRCPSCGMTTSWAYLVRGDLATAAATHAGGTLLGVLAAMVGPWLIISAAAARWVFFRPTGLALLAGLIIVVFVSFVDWLFRIGIG